MKKLLLFNIVGLLLAGGLCMGAAAYTATRLEAAPAPSSSASPPDSYDDDFQQGDAPGIAELLTGSDLSGAGGGASSQSVSDEAPTVGASSGEPSASGKPVSSKPASSKPASSKPASSKPASSKPASSKPASSKPASSKPVSSKPVSSKPVSSQPEPSGEPSPSEEPPAPAVPEGDSAALLDTLAGAVQREIIGVGTSPQPQYYEAYKAQAVASHSYMEYHRQRDGVYPTMSYARPDPQTVTLVSEVLDELIYYNGAVINASYHAASGGHTQSAAAVWGSDIPYLVGVESSYDDYMRTFSIPADAAAAKLSAAGIPTEGDPSEWFDLADAALTDGGFIDRISICGVTVRGRTLRESILGPSNLLSCKIADITWDGVSLQFTTLGFGHGAGMSQLGALGYAANEGWSYRDILSHYYTGVDIE